MTEAINIALEFMESQTVRAHLRGEFSKKDVHALQYKLCALICHARASLEDKAAALDKIAALLPDEKDDDLNLWSPEILAAVARQALAETVNIPPGSVFQFTRYNRSKVWDDYGGKDDYWMYEFDYEAIYESSEVCATFEQAMNIIRYDWDDDEEYVPDPADDYTQFWNEITRYDRDAKGELHAGITWTVGDSGTIWDVHPYDGWPKYDDMPLCVSRKDELWFAWRELSLRNDFHTLTPFAPGDIVTVDCRPFCPVFHAVVLSNRWPADCCSLQVVFVNSKRRISHGALTHLGILFPRAFVRSPFFSAFYRLEYYNGKLPRGEACIGELSEMIKQNPEWSELKEKDGRSYLTTYLEDCFDAASDMEERKINKALKGIEWKRLKNILLERVVFDKFLSNLVQ